MILVVGATGFLGALLRFRLPVQPLGAASPTS